MWKALFYARLSVFHKYKNSMGDFLNADWCQKKFEISLAIVIHIC